MTDAAETNEGIARPGIRLPKPEWNDFKVQAIREKVTVEQLAAKAFRLYLASPEAKRIREED